MHKSTYAYHDGETLLHGFLAHEIQDHQPRPAVIVAHDWSGCNAFACEKAMQFAQQGFVGFALDMYGQGKTGETVAEKQALMAPLLADRDHLQRRIICAFETVASMPEVDATRIVAIGFCFGGLCVLDLARSGAKVAGVVSVHGLFMPPPQAQSQQSIGAKILALHGYDDPMVTHDAVADFCQEMTARQADWQIHQYGHTQHGFTNPQANDPAAGIVYNLKATNRAEASIGQFLAEIFA